MIGYYVHHAGAGHANRALALTRGLDVEVTGLSSAPRPDGWPGAWFDLERDDTGLPDDPTAGGALHWAPRRHAGLRSRMAEISAWLEETRPDLLVVDVSVEVTLLARLHGVPVIVMAQPGVRDDPPHSLVYQVADRVVAPWPRDVEDILVTGEGADPQLTHIGAVSRFDDRIDADASPRRPGRRVTVMSGRGGSAIARQDLDRARAATPQWEWTLAGAGPGAWTDDPWPLLRDADVVLTHAGQNALAEVAAARRPAIVVPENRPHLEQVTTAHALHRHGRWPVVALESFPGDGWPALLDLASALDGERWATWNDGKAASRFADVVHAELMR